MSRLSMMLAAASVAIAGLFTPAQSVAAPATPAPTNVRVSVETNWAEQQWLQISWDEAWPTGWEYVSIHTTIDGVESCLMGAMVPEVPTSSCRESSLLDRMQRGHIYTVIVTASVYYDGDNTEYTSPPTSVQFTLPELPPEVRLSE